MRILKKIEETTAFVYKYGMLITLIFFLVGLAVGLIMNFSEIEIFLTDRSIILPVMIFPWFSVISGLPWAIILIIALLISRMFHKDHSEKFFSIRNIKSASLGVMFVVMIMIFISGVRFAYLFFAQEQSMLLYEFALNIPITTMVIFYIIDEKQT